MTYPRIATRARKRPGNGKRLFGTSGIRGVVGQDLSTGLCLEAAQAVGTTLAPHSKVCIATDTRVSREIIKRVTIAGLRFSGIDVTDLGVLPTPALAFLTGDMGFDTGVMITASHNPPRFNGIKLFNGNCVGYSREQEEKIEKVYLEKEFRIGYLGSLDQSQEAKERYFQCMQHRFPTRCFNHSIRIVVDPGNGAASGFASELFSTLGFDVIPLNDEPDGRFPGRNPEPREDTLEGTVEFARQQNADLAVCFDGDADRVVFCDREGFLGFNEPIAFICRLVIEQNKGTQARRVATTVETGRIIDLALRDLGVEVIRGKVGDVNVAYLAREVDAPIGVEEVGVYIIPERGYYPDSFFAVLTLLSQTNDPGEIRDFFKNIPRLALRKAKVPCPEELKGAVMEAVGKSSFSFGPNEINTMDGLRFEFGDSWMLIRASGTEPVIRVTAESISSSEAEALLRAGTKTIEENLRRLRL
jgi:phosphoglucosamine mutase